MAHTCGREKSGLIARTLGQIPFVPRRTRIAASAEMALLERLAAHVVLSQVTPGAARVMAWLDRLCWPVAAVFRLKEIPRDVVEAAASQASRSRLRYLLTTWWTCARFGISPGDHYKFGLHMPDLQVQAGDFILTTQGLRIYDALFARTSADELVLLRDKDRFREFCQNRDIPSPRTLALAAGGDIVFLEARDSAIWRGDIIMKPQVGSNGIGFYRWVWQKDSRYVGALGESVSLDDVLVQVANFSKQRPILVQRRLVNDEATSRLTSGALATVRILTARHGSGAIEVVAAAIKMPVGRSLVDNYMRGNVLSQVDPEAGTMKPGQFYYDRLVSITCHPGTGTHFAGLRVPQWDEMRRLAVSTHGLLPTVVLLAFDIAPTPDGPVMVEANARGDLSLMQYPGGRPLGQTAYPGIVLSHFRGE